MGIEQLVAWFATQWWASYLMLSLFIFALLLVNRSLRNIFERIERLAGAKGGWRYRAIVFSVRKPLRLVVFVLGILSALRIFLFKDLTDMLVFIDMAIRCVFLVSFAWAGSRFLFCVERHFVKSGTGFAGLDKDAAKALCKLGKISLFIALILLIMDTVGIRISALLAFGGLGGLVLGFASKDVLSNIFGGLMLILDRPFSEGDWIRSPDRDIEGTVVKIGWRTTVIETFSRRPLYVPNSLFSTISVENPSRMRNRRIKELIGISYEDMAKADAIVGDIEHLIRTDSRTDHTQTSFARVVQFDVSSVNILLYCFTKTTEWIKFQEHKQAIMLEVAKIIEAHGASIPFPTQTLHLADKAPAVADQRPFAGTQIPRRTQALPVVPQERKLKPTVAGSDGGSE